METAAQADFAEAVADKICRADLDLRANYSPPETAFEEALSQIWQEALSLDLVGLDDDFFELGGDSFSAATIATRIETVFSVDFPVSLIMDFPTVRSLATYISKLKDSREAAPNILIPVRPQGSNPPLFLVHGAHGLTFLRPDFFDYLDPEIPVYVFYAKGFDGRHTPNESVESIAADYIDAMRERYPNGPYYLAGMCAGTLVALEMAQQLRREDDSVATLVLIDPPMMPIAVEDRFPLSALYRMRNAKGRPPHLALIIWLIMVLRRLGWLSGPKAPEKTKILDRLFDGIIGESTKQEEERYLRRFARRQYHGQFDLQPDAAINVVLGLRKAWQEYVPKLYEKPVHLVVSARRAPFFENPDYFWHSVLPNKSIHIVSEKHASIMRNDGALTGQEIQMAIACVNSEAESPFSSTGKPVAK